MRNVIKLSETIKLHTYLKALTSRIMVEPTKTIFILLTLKLKDACTFAVSKSNTMRRYHSFFVLI